MNFNFSKLITTTLFLLVGEIAIGSQVKPWNDSLKCDCEATGNTFSISCRPDDQSFSVSYNVNCYDLSAIHERGRTQTCSGKSKAIASKDELGLSLTKWRVEAVNANQYRIKPSRCMGESCRRISSSPISCYSREEYFDQEGKKQIAGFSTQRGPETLWRTIPGSARRGAR